jgi:hypothetical protein
LTHDQLVSQEICVPVAVVDSLKLQTHDQLEVWKVVALTVLVKSLHEPDADGFVEGLEGYVHGQLEISNVNAFVLKER